VIALKHLTGWAVKVKRADGSSGLAVLGRGSLPNVFSEKKRKDAVKFRNELQMCQMDARVVPVTYAHPVEIPKS